MWTNMDVTAEAVGLIARNVREIAAATGVADESTRKVKDASRQFAAS